VPYVSCEEAWCDYPKHCQSDHWVPDPPLSDDLEKSILEIEAAKDAVEKALERLQDRRPRVDNSLLNAFLAAEKGLVETIDELTEAKLAMVKP